MPQCHAAGGFDWEWAAADKGDAAGLLAGLLADIRAALDARAGGELRAAVPYHSAFGAVPSALPSRECAVHTVGCALGL